MATIYFLDSTSMYGTNVSSNNIAAAIAGKWRGPSYHFNSSGHFNNTGRWSGSFAFRLQSGSSDYSWQSITIPGGAKTTLAVGFAVKASNFWGYNNTISSSGGSSQKNFWFAFYPAGHTPDFPNISGSNPVLVCQFTDGDTTNGTYGNIKWFRQSGGTYTQLGATTTINSYIPTNSVWRYVEVKVVRDATSGSITMKIDGNTVFSFSGNTGSVDLGSFYLMNDANSSSSNPIDGLYTDVYAASDFVAGGSTSRVWVSPLTAAGFYSEWTPSTGANYAAVDENPISGSDYISGTVGNKDTYKVTEPAAANTPVGTIHGVAMNYYSSIGTGLALDGLYYSLGNNTLYEFDNPAPVIGSAGITQSIASVNPRTSAAWLAAEFDTSTGGELGVKNEG